MSVCGQTEEDSGAEEMGAPGRDLYEQKAVSKVVRVLTVLAYLLSVSLAAILLSIYYVCVWKSPDLPPANGTLDVQAHRAGGDYYAAPALLIVGGSNTTVSENATQTLNNTSDYPNITDEVTPADFADTDPADATSPAGSTDASATDGVGDGVT